MIWILTISLLLATNALSADIKTSLTIFDNNLQTLNDKIVVDEKQALIDLLLQTSKQLDYFWPLIRSKMVPTAVDGFMVPLIQYWSSFIGKESEKQRNRRYQDTQRLRTVASEKGILEKMNLIYQDINLDSNSNARQCMRFAFLNFMETHSDVLELLYQRTPITAVLILEELSNQIILTKDNLDPETIDLIKFMKTSGNKKLKTIAETCEHLWSIAKKN